LSGSVGGSSRSHQWQTESKDPQCESCVLCTEVRVGNKRSNSMARDWFPGHVEPRIGSHSFFGRQKKLLCHCWKHFFIAPEKMSCPETLGFCRCCRPYFA
jgi:hypothetical protein